MSWWRYRGRCTGRVLHFLYHYVGFDAAERARVGAERVDLYDETIATFVWSQRFGEKDVPEFVFTAADAGWCMQNQVDKREAAILDALPEAPEDPARTRVPWAAIDAVNLDIVRSSRLWSQGVHKAEPAYFVALMPGSDSASQVLWCKAGDTLYYWHREMAVWLRGPKDEETSS